MFFLEKVLEKVRKSFNVLKAFSSLKKKKKILRAYFVLKAINHFLWNLGSGIFPSLTNFRSSSVGGGALFPGVS